MTTPATHRELEGRIALVTGVSRRAGIGAAIATELAHAGAHLAVIFVIIISIDSPISFPGIN